VDSSSKPAPFSFATIEAFDAHIGQSIPGFAHLVDMVVGLGSCHLDRFATVYDLGCSTGSLLVRLSAEFPALDLNLVGYDIEPAILGQVAELYPATAGRCSIQDITDPDFRLYPGAGLVTSIFTLQFLPQWARPVLVRRVYDALRPGGAFIVAEKIYQDSGQLEQQFCFAGYDFKQRSFTPAQILSKQADLRHIMHPLTEAENVTMFHRAGFNTVVPFWQGLNFKAWLCIK
jgi:tRNA (cmo5U34)-methyltransferase